MQTGASNSAAVQALFANLVDYAGLFPPAQLSMEEAVREYAAERQGRYAWMLGRFIVQHSRIEPLLAALPSGERFAVSVIFDRGAQALEHFAALQVEALEIVLASEQIEAYASAAQTFGLSAIPSYVELPRDNNWERAVPQAMDALAHAGLGAKIRCGGVDGSAFPTPQQVALFISWAYRYNVPFKATAGLHHPVRHFNAASGVMMHGFLNLLAAAALARAGANVADLTEAIACEDASRFVIDDRGLRFGDYHIGATELQSMRREAFIGYGSCSFSEPVEDLRALNLLS